jgi:hypothetical protein
MLLLPAAVGLCEVGVDLGECGGRWHRVAHRFLKCRIKELILQLLRGQPPGGDRGFGLRQADVAAGFSSFIARREREGPDLEGSDRHLFSGVEKLPDNFVVTGARVGSLVISRYSRARPLTHTAQSFRMDGYRWTKLRRNACFMAVPVTAFRRRPPHMITYTKAFCLLRLELNLPRQVLRLVARSCTVSQDVPGEEFGSE